MTLSSILADSTWVQDWWDQIVWIVPILATAFLWFARREVKGWKAAVIEEVKKSTLEIQPNKNGGKSLSDANGKLDSLKVIPVQLEALTALVERVDSTTQAMDKRLTDAIAAVGSRVTDQESAMKAHLQSHS